MERNEVQKVYDRLTKCYKELASISRAANQYSAMRDDNYTDTEKVSAIFACGTITAAENAALQARSRVSCIIDRIEEKYVDNDSSAT